MEPDGFDEDSQPCLCPCGNWFDLTDGNPCGTCSKVFCEDCVEAPFNNCEGCEPDDT